MSSAESTEPERPAETLLSPDDDGGSTEPSAAGERSTGDGHMAPGTLLDDYEIVAPLGEGGMGQVYRVRHRRLDREFALKIISARHVSLDAVQRFEREMKAAGRTNHPNVILATDAGECRGWHYLVMELVPGIDLARLIKKYGPMPVVDACEVIRQAALGLQAVHEAGLVHRDIKPPNLMLTPDGTVKVLDLGLARLVGDPGDTLTQYGSMGGTADYMAPEQALDLRSAKITADLYSLGCTLYCLLAGHPPFGTGKHSSFASKLMAHSNEPVPPIASLRPELTNDPRLLRLLDRMLAKAPTDRPAEPREVAELLAPLCAGHDLAQWASGQPGTGPKTIPGMTTSTFARRGPLDPRRRRQLAAAMSVVACLGLIVGLLAWARGPRPPRFTMTTLPPPQDLRGAKGDHGLPLPPLRIESMQILHYSGNPAQNQGTIGIDSHAAWFDDNVRVSARLSAPGYCYLIALNPDGSIQLCSTAKAGVAPSPTDEIVYPPDIDKYYGLTDGTGLQAFVLVASRVPLPPFDTWPARAGLTWAAAAPGEAWRYDGHDFTPLGERTRGIERPVATAAPAPFAAVCRYLSRLKDVDAVQATAFPVVSKERSQVPSNPMR
jgi:serine/threonine protein kinase